MNSLKPGKRPEHKNRLSQILSTHKTQETKGGKRDIQNFDRDKRKNKNRDINFFQPSSFCTKSRMLGMRSMMSGGISSSMADVRFCSASSCQHIGL